MLLQTWSVHGTLCIELMSASISLECIWLGYYTWGVLDTIIIYLGYTRHGLYMFINTKAVTFMTFMENTYEICIKESVIFA